MHIGSTSGKLIQYGNFTTQEKQAKALGGLKEDICVLKNLPNILSELSIYNKGIIQDEELHNFIEQEDIFNNLTQDLPNYIKDNLKTISNNPKYIEQLEEYIKQSIITKIIDPEFLKNPSIMADLLQCLKYFNLTPEEQTKIAFAYSKLSSDKLIGERGYSYHGEEKFLIYKSILNIVQHIQWSDLIAQYRIKKIMLHPRLSIIMRTYECGEILEQKAIIIGNIPWKNDKDKLDLVKMISQHQLFIKYKSKCPYDTTDNTPQPALKEFILHEDRLTLLALINTIGNLVTPESQPYIAQILSDYIEMLVDDHYYENNSWIQSIHNHDSDISYKKPLGYNDNITLKVFNTIIQLVEQIKWLSPTDKDIANRNLNSLKMIVFKIMLKSIDLEIKQIDKSEFFLGNNPNDPNICFTYAEYQKISKKFTRHTIEDVDNLDTIFYEEFNNESQIYILIANNVFQPYMKDDLYEWLSINFINPLTKAVPIFVKRGWRFNDNN